MTHIRIAGSPMNSHSSNIRSLLAAGIALAVFSSFPLPAAEIVVEPVKPRPYMRVGNPDRETVELQIALRKFRPANGEGPTVWLSAVSHLGDTNYFAQLQQHLDEVGLVLFEGVGGPPPKPEPDAGDDSKPNQKEVLGGVQTTMAESLGLVFQLEAIDYDRDNFQSSDMSLGQLRWLMMGGDEAELPPRNVPVFRAPTPKPKGEEGAAKPNPEFERLMQVMDGSSVLGGIVDMTLRMIGSSPKLQAMTRLMFIETLGRLQGDLTQMQGLPPDMQELIKVLIRSRNRIVLEDLKEAIQSDHPPPSVSVFYGAGHMDDFEKRMRAELNYEPAGDVWLKAFDINTRESGIGEFEKRMIRYMIDIQMQMLNPSAPSQKQAAPGKAQPSTPNNHKNQ